MREVEVLSFSMFFLQSGSSGLNQVITNAISFIYFLYQTQVQALFTLVNSSLAHSDCCLIDITDLTLADEEGYSIICKKLSRATLVSFSFVEILKLKLGQDFVDQIGYNLVEILKLKSS